MRITQNNAFGITEEELIFNGGSLYLIETTRMYRQDNFGQEHTDTTTNKYVVVDWKINNPEYSFDSSCIDIELELIEESSEKYLDISYRHIFLSLQDIVLLFNNPNHT